VRDRSNPESRTQNPVGRSLYACIYQPPAADQPAASANTLVDIAQEFSPRYERHCDDLVSIDVSGLDIAVIQRYAFNAFDFQLSAGWHQLRGSPQ